MMFGLELLSSCFWLDNKPIFGPTNDDWLVIYSQFIKCILMLMESLTHENFATVIGSYSDSLLH